MAISKGAVVIAALIALAGSGCTQPDPNAKPTYACTPSEGGSPHPCYKAEHDLQVKEDKLYAEAEAVLRKFVAEEERINRIGGASEPTPIVRETLTGDYLNRASEGFRALKQAQATAEGGAFEIAWIERAPREARQGTIATLKMCLDTSSVKMGSAGNKARPGRITERTVFFVKDGDRLKIAQGRYQWVSQC